eukprot:CAMPEP_0174835518 /NCGR_PEP_ID=MMETSP1114-20130205/5448_1 /TAXON_ID=312471 /ORGANISM="Neobodo designis, Strain CCAP 1951/1" /LENGTH=671 /DNA_ID=CAMNT_0016069469 /DNA_START=6 /DNA_END=2018 /DNA_ORIENTATION=+
MSSHHRRRFGSRAKGGVTQEGSGAFSTSQADAPAGASDSMAESTGSALQRRPSGTGLHDLEALLNRDDFLRSPSPPTALASTLHPHDRRSGGEHSDESNDDDGSGAASPLVPRRSSSDRVPSPPPIDEPPASFTRASASNTPRGQGSSAVRSLRSTPRRERESRESSGSPRAGRGHSAVEESPAPSSKPPPAAVALDVPHDMRCPVCLDAFSNPVTLRCYHNVCRTHVRDLAATRGRRDGDEPGAIVVECPKCRDTTSFADAESIRVNTEMKAIVDMMLNMLRQQQQQQRERTPPRQKSAAGGDAAPTPSTGPRSAVKAARVRFADDDDGAPGRHRNDDDGDGAATAAPPKRSPPTSSRTRPASQQQPPAQASSDHQPPPGHRQAQKLADLERQLEAKRQQMIAEREKRNREATEEFKRQRMQEILSRKAVMASVEEAQKRKDDPLLRKPVALRIADGEDVPAHERAVLPLDEERFRAQEAAFLAAKQERERQREAEREAREREVRDALQDWLKEDRMSFDTEAETKAFAAKMQEAVAGRPLTESVRRDAMRQAAEQRLPPMPEPRPAVPTAASPDAERLMQTPFKDIEVELRMLESEREVQREVDDALSRAEMAAIAERRARETVDRFRRQEQRNRPWSKGAVGTYEPPPVASSPGAAGVAYTPKLSRLR